MNPDGDPLTVTVGTPPGNGVVVLDPETGEFIYTPNPGYEGPDYFTYILCDEAGNCDEATVYINVFPAPSLSSPPEYHPPATA